LQDSKLVEKQFTKHDVTDSYASSDGMSVGFDNKSCHDTIEALNQKEINDCDTITRCGSVKENQDMDVDNSSVFASKNKKERKRSVKTLQVSADQKVQHHSNECTSPIQVCLLFLNYFIYYLLLTLVDVLLQELKGVLGCILTIMLSLHLTHSIKYV
jgi:hypothetical protein